jgi:hypothetical protein
MTNQEEDKPLYDISKILKLTLGLVFIMLVAVVSLYFIAKL